MATNGKQLIQYQGEVKVQENTQISYILELKKTIQKVVSIGKQE